MSKIIYSKCSNERSPEFSLRTMILEDEEKRRIVKKIPDTVLAQPHVVQIEKWYHALKEQYADTGIVINQCQMTDKGIQLEYLEAKSLEYELDVFVENQDSEGFCKLLDRYFSILSSVHQSVIFCMTEEFRKVFGDVFIKQEEKCGTLTNIDALFSNILILNENKWCMLDYEWTFSFPIPLKFLLYRILFYYVHEHDKRKCVLDWYPMEKLGISQEDEALFSEMEMNFQRYIQGKRIPVRDMYDTISPGIIQLDDMCYFGKAELLKRQVQIYHVDHDDIVENDSVFCKMDKNNHFEKSFHLMDGVRYFRVDPCSCKCLVKNLSIRADSKELKYLTNGIPVLKNLFFDTEDPYILLETPESYEKETIDIEFDVEFLGDATFSYIKTIILEKEKIEETKKILRQKEDECETLQNNYAALQGNYATLNHELENKKRLIAEMENTKVWKAYQKYKSVVSR